MIQSSTNTSAGGLLILVTDYPFSSCADRRFEFRDTTFPKTSIEWTLVEPTNVNKVNIDCDSCIRLVIKRPAQQLVIITRHMAVVRFFRKVLLGLQEPFKAVCSL